jgi:hypothetical protein
VRVLQVVYSFERAALPVYVGQQMDVFIEAAPAARNLFGRSKFRWRRSLGASLDSRSLLEARPAPHQDPNWSWHSFRATDAVKASHPIFGGRDCLLSQAGAEAGKFKNLASIKHLLFYLPLVSRGEIEV